MTPRVASRPDASLVAGLTVAVGALVFATRTQQQTGDSLSYAWSVREALDPVHPHHLAFLPTLHALYLAWGSGEDPAAAVLLTAQLHGAFWAAVGVAAVFVALRALGFTRGWGVIAAAAVLFTQGYWVLATHASPYVPSVACVAVALAVLVSGDGTTPSPRRLVVVSMAWAGAVLFHQAHALFAISLIASLVAWAPRRIVRSAVAALAPGGGAVFLAYVAAFASTGGEHGLERFARFVTRYSHAARPHWGNLDNVGLSGIGVLLRNQMWNVVAVPRGAVPAATVAFGVLTAALLVWHVVRVARGAVLRPARVLLMTWLVAYWALALWWLPSETKLYSLTVVPLVLLGAIAVRDAAPSPVARPVVARAVRVVAAVLVCATGVLHLAMIILPAHARPKSSFVEAQRIVARVPGVCAALVDYEVAQSLRYHFNWRDTVPRTAGLLRADQDRRLDTAVAISEAPCAIVALDILFPGRQIGGFDGDREPFRWLRHLEWLVGAERDVAGEIVATRELTVFVTGPGRVYLQIGSRPEPVGGLGGLCERLDTLRAQASGERAREFSEWFEGHHRGLR